MLVVYLGDEEYTGLCVLAGQFTHGRVDLPQVSFHSHESTL